jgi:hypothetical protein
MAFDFGFVTFDFRHMAIEIEYMKILGKLSIKNIMTYNIYKYINILMNSIKN